MTSSLTKLSAIRTPAPSALYAGGERRSDCFYRLSFYKNIASTDRQLRVTPAVVAQVKESGDFPYELTTGGVRGRDVVKPFPYVYIRTANGKGPTGAWQVFLTTGELENLSAEFGLTPQVVERSFFASRSYLHSLTIEIAPILFELLEPVRRTDFLNWVAHPAPPDPPGLPWQTSASFLSFPALVPKVSFSKKKEGDVHGRFTFHSIGTEAHAFFHFGNKTRSYRLGLDQIDCLGDGQLGWADFNRTIFAKLFGGKPALTEYSFTKRVGEYILIEDRVLVLTQPTGCRLWDKGEMYFLRLVRRENELFLFCHRNQATPRPLAWFCWPLPGGQMPAGVHVTARKPDDGMPGFGIMA